MKENAVNRFNEIADEVSADMIRVLRTFLPNVEKQFKEDLGPEAKITVTVEFAVKGEDVEAIVRGTVSAPKSTGMQIKLGWRSGQLSLL